MELREGLNVVIGPRGAGKTTLLELIRHALGIEHADAAAAKRHQALITNLLGAGEVILEMQNGLESRHIVVDARGKGRSPQTSTAALALGQNELEQIASNSASRLHLIDLRASVDADAPSMLNAVSLTREIARARTEADGLAASQARLPILQEEREAAILREAEFLAQVDQQLTNQRDTLRVIENEVIRLSTQLESAKATSGVSTRVIQTSITLQEALMTLSEVEGGVALSAIIEPRLADMRPHLAQIQESMSGLLDDLSIFENTLEERQVALQLQAEPLRSGLEAAETGLGQVTARIRNIDSELAELRRLAAQREVLTRQVQISESARDEIFDEFSDWQEGLFQARQQIASQVSSDLRSRVIVQVEHLADNTSFRDILLGTLQGSGLQYRAIADVMSRALLPRQLLNYVESSDSKSLALATGMPEDRAVRVIAHLGNADLINEIASATLEDKVDFRLHDGTVDKSVDELSTGQKCAVTLPIVLTELSRILILDQPEDHLDNAYLVGNVVSALTRRRASGAQTIVATHNANIPVLGSADQVLSMESDGVRGFIETEGSFDTAAIVSTITRLMEGGRDAFQKRASFYGEHEESF
ncbi:AAA family ATPase [Rathayibacter sp. AY1C2]|uniref:AAA family ATPase n=1 Tax=Rathayibacter sp. AY1C2 TaxID=2080535 RepID=UPI0015E2E541|nr:AAA family ATPase [Rathayibacter sp. AY1C2]